MSVGDWATCRDDSVIGQMTFAEDPLRRGGDAGMTPEVPQEISDERIYEDLRAYQGAGMLDYVLPTDPLGEQWIIGWRGQILKFISKEGIVGFLAGIQAGALSAASLPSLAEKVRREEGRMPG